MYGKKKYQINVVWCNKSQRERMNTLMFRQIFKRKKTPFYKNKNKIQFFTMHPKRTTHIHTSHAQCNVRREK